MTTIKPGRILWATVDGLGLPRALGDFASDVGACRRSCLPRGASAATSANQIGTGAARDWGRLLAGLPGCFAAGPDRESRFG